jgi:uncharacterized protein
MRPARGHRIFEGENEAMIRFRRFATATAVLAIIATALAPARAATPSFDCAKAGNAIEKTICADDPLAVLDRQLAGVFGEALKTIAGYGGTAAVRQKAENELKASQRTWIKGRNDCAKAADQRACATDAYRSRIAMLQARFSLIAGSDPQPYGCNGNDADELTVTFFPTDPPALRAERGDSQTFAVQVGGGTRYVGDLGVSFQETSREATVEWPQGTVFYCTRKQ